MTDTPTLPMSDTGADKAAGKKPDRDNCRWTTGDDGHLVDKLHLGWAMKKVAESLERTTLGCLNRFQRILDGKVPTPAGFDAIVADLKDRAAVARRTAAATRAAQGAGPTAGAKTPAGAARSMAELHRRMGRIEAELRAQGRMRQLELAIDLAAGRVTMDVLTTEIGAVSAGQCGRLAKAIADAPAPVTAEAQDHAGQADEAGEGQS